MDRALWSEPASVGVATLLALMDEYSSLSDESSSLSRLIWIQYQKLCQTRHWAPWGLFAYIFQDGDPVRASCIDCAVIRDAQLAHVVGEVSRAWRDCTAIALVQGWQYSRVCRLCRCTRQVSVSHLQHEVLEPSEPLAGPAPATVRSVVHRIFSLLLRCAVGASRRSPLLTAGPTRGLPVTSKPELWSAVRLCLRTLARERRPLTCEPGRKYSSTRVSRASCHQTPK
jgi:hypothetical protein